MIRSSASFPNTTRTCNRIMHRLQGTFQRQLDLSSISRQCGLREFSSIPRKKSGSPNPSGTMHNSNTTNNNDDTSAEDTIKNNKQPFVKYKLEPGEWDINRRDPYHRPKPPRNKLTSAEDFANRPPVGFDNEFSTYEDSMIALSWLDAKTCKSIYSLYMDMMVRHQTEHPGRTSHEYVCRVLAQRFQITTWRAAGVVQLQHAEEQMRRNNPELLCEDQAQWAENTILKNIQDAYKSQRALPPNRGRGGEEQAFVEDPVGIHGLGEPDEISSSWTTTDDIYDMETKLQKANTRDEELAKILIDEHVYKEDVDESTVQVRTDGVAKRLIKAQQKQKEENKQQSKEDNKVTAVEGIPNTENNGQGNKRPRWKYVAQVVNTRAMRKKGKKITSYANNNMENTLVEEDGTLRVATVEEAKKAAWKPTRTRGNEYIYEGVKKDWLKKTIKGSTDVWGRAPVTAAAAAVQQGGQGEGNKKAAETISEKTPSEEKEEIKAASDPTDNKEPESKEENEIKAYDPLDSKKPENKEENESSTTETNDSIDEPQNKETNSEKAEDTK